MEIEVENEKLKEIVKFLKLNRNIAKLSKACSIRDWHLIVNKMQQSLNEIEKLERERVSRENAKHEQFLLHAEKLKDEGIDIDELSAFIKKNGGKRRAKYSFIDKNGNEQTWSGMGKKPKDLQYLLSKGANLEDFLIK